MNALSTRHPHDLMKESRTVGHDGRATLLPFEAVTFARQADQPTRAPNQADRTPCYHRFESKNRSARNPDSGPVRQPPKQRVPQRLWKAPMPSSTLLAARVHALAMVLAVGLAAAPSHAGDDVRAGPTRTAKERLGGKASDEQRLDNCKVPPDLRGPKPRPEQCDDGTGKKRLTAAAG